MNIVDYALMKQGVMQEPIKHEYNALTNMSYQSMPKFEKQLVKPDYMERLNVLGQNLLEDKLQDKYLQKDNKLKNPTDQLRELYQVSTMFDLYN